MADDTRLNAGSGGDLIATDELGTINSEVAATGLKIQRVKICHGAPNNADDVNLLSPLPVDIRTIQANQAVAGTTAHDIPATAVNPVLIGGFANSAAPANVVNADAVKAWFLQNGAQVTSMQAAGALIGGDATNGLDVDVTRLPALVAGSAEIGRVRLTDGTDLAGISSDGMLQVESDIPADQQGSGSITANGQTVAVTATKGRAAFAWHINGTWVGTLTFEISADGGSNYVAHRVHNGVDSVSSITSAGTDKNGVYAVGSIAAVTHIRLRATAWTSGTANINHNRSVASAAALLNLPLPSGTNNIGDVDVASIAAGANAIGNVGLEPRASGGLDKYAFVSAASTNAANVKNAAGQVFGWYIYNSNAAARKLVFHNTSGTPTAGSSVFFSVVVPPTGGTNVWFGHGIAFGTGIGVTMVTGLADSDATAVAANDLVGFILYK